MSATFRLSLAALFIVLGLSMRPSSAALVARYSFDNSTAADLSGNNNDGVVGSNVFFTADAPFRSGLAAGTLSTSPANATRVISVPTSSSLESIDDNLTLSFWMKATTGTNANWVRIFQHGTEGNPSRTWLVDRNADTADVNVRVDTNLGTGGVFNQNIAVGGTPAFDGAWHHVFYRLNNGSYAEYVDGLLSTSGSYTPGDGLYNTNALYIFGGNNYGQYVGLLDDIAIWNDAKGPSWAATIAGLADWYGTSLNDPGLGDVASLSTLGQMAVAGDKSWIYTNLFPAARTGGALAAGRHYLGVNDVPYIIFQSDGKGGWLGVQQVPEPGTLVLLGLSVLGLTLGRFRLRKAWA
jgi:hypothetical protein